MSRLLARGKEAAADFRLLSLGLVPAERAWLHQRIAQRFELMLEQDFLAEVRRLREQYPALTLELPSMRCVGYRQAWEYLDGVGDEQAFIDKGIAATRQLAKRQLTWMRSLDLVPINAQQPGLAEQLCAAVAACQPASPCPPACVSTAPTKPAAPDSPGPAGRRAQRYHRRVAAGVEEAVADPVAAAGAVPHIGAPPHSIHRLGAHGIARRRCRRALRSR